MAQPHMLPVSFVDLHHPLSIKFSANPD